MDPIDLHRRTLTVFADRLAAVTAQQWTSPTPCPEWDLRALVNHVAAGTRWVAPMIAGRPIDEVTGLDGDLLGDDPVAAFRVAAAEAVAAFDQPGAAQATIHASVGSFPGGEYAWQRGADVLIHAWDLATAIHTDTELPDDLVQAVAGWFDGMEDTFRELGVIGERAPMPPEADTQTRLLAQFGRTSPAA